MSKSTAVSEQQLKLKPCGRCSQKLKSSCAHTSGINGQLNPYFPLLTITGEICPHCMCYYVNIHFVYICFPMRSHEGDHGRWCNALSGVIRLAVCVCVCVCVVCAIFLNSCDVAYVLEPCSLQSHETTRLLLHSAMFTVYSKCVHIECVVCENETKYDTVLLWLDWMNGWRVIHRIDTKDRLF